MTVQRAGGGGDAARIVELFSGIDSLYLSGHTEVSPRALLADLAGLKVRAGEGRDPVTIDLGPASFDVQAAGFGRYKYRLDHRHGVLAVTDSSQLPTFRVQPRGSSLHGVGPTAAVRWWKDV